MPVILSLLMFGLLLRIGYEGTKKEKTIFLRNVKDYIRAYGEKGKNTDWYHRWDRWLKKNGVAFHMGKRMNPFGFLALRMLMSLLGLAVMSRINILCGILTMTGLYFLPAALAVYLNGQDNKRLLPELKLIYHALEIQIRAGVYVTQALAECFSCVSEIRLKAALMELAGDIVMHADLYGAMSKFQDSFDNRHVDALCITLLQAMESGQAVELLSDLAEQMKDMEIALMAGKKEALDRSITFYQLGILAAVMGVVLYACVTSMFAAATNL